MIGRAALPSFVAAVATRAAAAAARREAALQQALQIGPRPVKKRREKQQPALARRSEAPAQGRTRQCRRAGRGSGAGRDRAAGAGREAAARGGAAVDRNKHPRPNWRSGSLNSFFSRRYDTSVSRVPPIAHISRTRLFLPTVACMSAVWVGGGRALASAARVCGRARLGGVRAAQASGVPAPLPRDAARVPRPRCAVNQSSKEAGASPPNRGRGRASQRGGARRARRTNKVGVSLRRPHGKGRHRHAL